LFASPPSVSRKPGAVIRLFFEMVALRHALIFPVLGLARGDDFPFWGCGLLGPLPGINADGSATPTMQKFIDALKSTNSYSGKVSYWNWNYAPMVDGGGKTEYLTKDFVFMPEEWGVMGANEKYVRQANSVGFLDNQGQPSPAQMADIFLGSNEPDIYGSCMGDMMGACTGPCTDAEAGDCPIAHFQGETPGKPSSTGHCNCYSDAHATGVGFWTVPGVSKYQPLPTCWSNPECVSVVMGEWKKSAAMLVTKGYKYLTAPLVAVSMDWMRSFVKEACKECTDMSCGCPTHVAWHFYANDCQPEKGGYDSFQHKLDKTVELMNEFPHLKGAIVNEVGMLNCAMNTPDAICVPNGPDMKYPAMNQTDHACPVTESLPKGLGSFIEHLLEQVGAAKAQDGRRAVVSFTWFNENMDGGTYNLRLFNDDGSLNLAGESYISACQKWAAGAAQPVELVV